VGADDISFLCRVCGAKMSQVFGEYEDFPWHPLCAPDDACVPGTDETYFELGLRETLTSIIKWADNNATRSQQVMLGCSEIGDACDRKIAMTMVGLDQANYETDPWPSIVGTAIHTWLETAMARYQEVHGVVEWLTEMEVWPSRWLPGHTDLYHRPTGTVLDLKNPSRTNFRKMMKDGIGDTYEVQIQAYGMGNVRAGRPVKRVGIVMLPRDGNLSEMRVLTRPYDPAVVEKAFGRIEGLADLIEKLDLVNHPERWGQVSHAPSRLCGWCKFYSPKVKPGLGGCPGKYGPETDNLFT